MDSPQETPAGIIAAFEVSRIIPGSVYVEARSPADVLAAIRDLNGVPSRPHLEFVPLGERPLLLDCHFIDIEAGTWVRVRRGKYRNDLAYVQTVNRVANEATVLLVPRLSPQGGPQAGKKSQKGKEKRSAQVRPRACLFDPLLNSSFRQLDEGRFESRGQLFRGGLIEMIIPDHRLGLATPTPEELDSFGRSQGVDASVIAKSWSEYSVAAVTPDTQVRIMSGEQSGLIGHALLITGDTCQFRPQSQPKSIIDVHLSNLRVHFCVGDYVRVKTGIFVGSVGWVTQVEQMPETDVVTFIDEASMKEGRPKEVSIFRLSLQHFI
jgi:transcription elongation factor SPT5